MITLEISPDILGSAAAPKLAFNTHAVEDNREKTQIHITPSGELMGLAQQTNNPMHMVRFYQGKGGFCAVVTGKDLVYFGLPGSRIELSDTLVELPGEKIQGKFAKKPVSAPPAPKQALTKQAMILGAGLATRFEPVSGDTTGYPKPGVPLLGKDSVITVIAKLLQQHGIQRILINTFYKPQCLKSQLANLPGLEICYIDEDTPSGTAGGLAKALQQGLVDTTMPLLIIQGDSVTDADFSLLLKSHEDHHAAVTIGGQIVADKDVDKFGIIETDGSGGDGQSGNITSFKEKPSLAQAGNSRFGNAGFYVLAPEVYPLFQQTGQKHQSGLYDYAKDFFPAVLEAIKSQSILSQGDKRPMTFWAQAVGGYWSDIGNPTQYLEALRDVYAGHLNISLPADASRYYENDIFYWPGTKPLSQREEAQLSGNVIVAKSYCP